MNLFSRVFALFAILVAGSTASAATFSPTGSVDAGGFVTVQGDVQVAGLVGFDLYLTVPSELALLSAAYKDFPTLAGAYQEITSTGPTGFVGGGFDFTYDGTNPYPLNGEKAFRVTDDTGFTAPFGEFNLFFAVSPFATPGSIINVPFSLRQYVRFQDPGVSGQFIDLPFDSNGAFDIVVNNPNVVPLPGGALLLLTGAGALLLARKRRRAA